MDTAFQQIGTQHFQIQNLLKEYVASLIGLYKKNIAVSCVGINIVIF